MIEVKKENTYKVLRPELFKEEEKLLGKYELWKNTAMTPTRLCFIKSFGSKDDMRYGTSNTTWFGFNPKTNELNLHCTAFGGMCGFIFDETTLQNPNQPQVDIECMEFTIKMIKELQEQGIIEVKL